MIGRMPRISKYSAGTRPTRICSGALAASPKLTFFRQVS